MRYEAGPHRGSAFFVSPKGAYCAVRAISRTAGSFLRSRGRGRIAGANHRAGGVNSCTAGGLLCGRGESAYSVLILPRMRARPLRVRGVAPMRASNSVSSIAVHAAASIVSGSKTGSNARLAVHRRLLVVGTAALAAVAAENPAVEVDPSGRLPFDGVARDAPARVDHLRGDDGARGTALDAVAAAAAAGTLERGVVGVGFVGQEQLAQQDVGAVAGRDEQRLAAYPAQSGLDGQLFFEQRGRIDERPAAESGIRRLSDASSMPFSIPFIVV